MSERRYRILIVTGMYPHPGKQGYGAFVMQQVQQLRAQGHEVDVLHFPGYRSKLEYMRAAIKVFFLTRRGRYSVVHAHYGLTGLAALFRNSTPLVLTVHGSDALVGWLQPFITKFIANNVADATIVVSNNVSRRIRGDIIPCGVDTSVFQAKPKAEARARLGLFKNRKYVLFPFDVRRAVKRYDIASAAVRQLTAEGLDIELLTVSQVSFHEMPWYYSAADLMVLCSDSEGSPTSLKEALACNLPVVSTDVGDVREIISGISGLEIVEQNAASLASGIKRLLYPPPEFVFNSRDAMARYSQQQTVHAVVEVYSRAIEQRSNVPHRRVPPQTIHWKR